MIKKRHMILTEEILKKNTHICNPYAISLDTRQDILTVEIPKLGKEAAIKAIEEWGQPKSKITSSSPPPMALTCLAPTTNWLNSLALSPLWNVSCSTIRVVMLGAWPFALPRT